MLPEPTLFAPEEKRDLNANDLFNVYTMHCFAFLAASHALCAMSWQFEDYFSLLVLVLPEGLWPFSRAAQ